MPRDILRTGPELIVDFIPTYRDSALFPDEIGSTQRIIEEQSQVLDAVKQELTKPVATQWSKTEAKQIVPRFQDALRKPTILWTLIAAQKLLGNYPDVDDANRMLAVMDSESRFDIDALNPSKAYGLLQIIPSNVKNIAAWPLATKLQIARTISPVIAWIHSVDPITANQMAKGQWPSSLLTGSSLWQIPYIAILWREAHTDAARAFKWKSGKWIASKEGSYPVKNSTFLKYMTKYPDFFNKKQTGLTAIIANLWKHGGPRGLYKDVPLRYLTAKVDHITPIVSNYSSLSQHATLPTFIETLFRESNPKRA